jgi:hypothetical protein
MSDNEGWYCDRVEGVVHCVPFGQFRKKGWEPEKSTPYTELFPNYKEHDIVIDTSCGMGRK